MDNQNRTIPKKPLNPWWTYVNHISMWFISGALLVMGMAAIENHEWVMVGIGFAGAAFLAWAAQGIARQVGFAKAMHEAYIEDEKRSQEGANAKH